MNRRSAMAIAAGVVAALLLGMAGMSVGLTATDPSRSADPIVRTITETVTVRRTPESNVVPAAPVLSAPASPAGSGSDDAFEDGHGDDREDEGEHDEGWEHEEEGEHEDD